MKYSADSPELSDGIRESFFDNCTESGDFPVLRVAYIASWIYSSNQRGSGLTTFLYTALNEASKCLPRPKTQKGAGRRDSSPLGDSWIQVAFEGSLDDV